MIKIHGLQFTVIGVFRERTSTFGQSELGDNGATLIPSRCSASSSRWSAWIRCTCRFATPPTCRRSRWR